MIGFAASLLGESLTGMGALDRIRPWECRGLRAKAPAATKTSSSARRSGKSCRGEAGRE